MAERIISSVVVEVLMVRVGVIVITAADIAAGRDTSTSSS